MNVHEIIKRICSPLRSRKVRVALATVVSACAAEYGFQVSEELLLIIFGIGASLILGIAHEDAGRLRSGRDPGKPEVIEAQPIES